ncbi:ASCH domain protein [compost metagenome]
MKAITIIQPWATLIALGEKRFETRNWATKHRGQIAIHASKKINKAACREPEIKAALARHGYTVDNLPTGVVLAVTELEECWEVSRCLRGDIVLEKDGGNTMREDPISKNEEAFGWYDPGRYAWEMADVRRLPEPIPAKGQQGLWNWAQVQ